MHERRALQDAAHREQAAPASGSMMRLLDQIAFGTTTLGLLVLLAAAVIGVLSVLPTALSLTGH